MKSMAKGKDTQEEALKKAAFIMDEILLLKEDVRFLLKYAIDKGGKFSKGVILRRKEIDRMSMPPAYIFTQIVSARVTESHSAGEPYIRLVLQPLTTNRKPDKRYKTININSKMVGPVYITC